MRTFLPLVGLLFLFSCGGNQDGFKAIGDSIQFKLISFEEGARPGKDGEAMRIEARTQRLFGDQDFRVRPLEVYYSKEFDEIFGTEVLRKSICALSQGDSALYRLPYSTVKGSVLSWEKGENDWPDSAQVEVAVRIDKVASAESMLKDLYQEVKAERQTEEYYLMHWMHSRAEEAHVLPWDEWRWNKSVHIQMLELNGRPLLDAGDPVEVDFVGRLPGGQEFVNSAKTGTTLNFVIGDPDQVVPGLDLALRYLSYGERAIVGMPSNQAFGEHGSPAAHIPPHTPVFFEVEVRRPSSEP